MISRITLVGATLSLVLLGSTAAGQVRYGSFPLSGGEAVPPNASSSTGTAEVSLDLSTNVLSWNISYSGFSATAAHFHGNAPAGSSAGVQVNIGTANPAINNTALFPSDSTDILNGLWYVNVHSSSFPGGEIRGQVHLSWEDLGGGTAGVNGTPTLTGGGPLTPGSTATLAVTNGPQSSLSIAWLAFGPVMPVSFDGGTVWTLPFTQQFVFPTSPVGAINLAVGWPAGLPSGTTARIQFLFGDSSVPSGITLSNGIQLTTP